MKYLDDIGRSLTRGADLSRGQVRAYKLEGRVFKSLEIVRAQAHIGDDHAGNETGDRLARREEVTVRTRANCG